ncbi:hypothetical protein ZYGR_0AI00320 [Zygosaccharomyces rouxii]|uniref:Dienelactone hydrolase domain-containing protein n=1 Tax=Zygosaccharomyces rouxii TaxID=4956 RepID=A0A1Q3AAX4_ZYGRO|nr:hypothetical protein ZYGR_0AI00320 [Zygosaccharomyces rouxii]
MASNLPGSCCARGFYHEGNARGTINDVYGVSTYITGKESNDKVIVILTDVYGYKFINTQLVADQLGDAGYRVYIPDILFGDWIESMDGSFDFGKWLAEHSAEKTRSVVDTFLNQFKKENPSSFVGVIGYCFGAKYAIQQISAKDGLADAAAIAHPSFVTVEEVEAVSKDKPLLISAAEKDHIFPPELRNLSVEKLANIGARYQIDLFSGASHGYAVRGDLTNPSVKYAKEKTFLDQIYWFNTFSSGK